MHPTPHDPRSRRFGFAAALACLAAPFCSGAETPLLQEGFEGDLAAWNSLQARDGTGQAVLDRESAHEGSQALCLDHPGQSDWHLDHHRALALTPGQLCELSAWTRCEGDGTAAIGFVVSDARQNVLAENFAAHTIAKADGWRQLRARFAVPPNAATLQLRVLGLGPVKLRLDTLSLASAGRLEAADTPAPAAATVANARLEVRFDPRDATFTALDRRAEKTWRQRGGTGLFVTDTKTEGETLRFSAVDPANLLPLSATVRLESAGAEFVVELSGSGALPAPLAYPAPWETADGDLLIVPVNEGIAYPVDDESLPPMTYVHYRPHGGLSMPWYGTTDGRRSLLEIVETCSDAVLEIPRRAGRLQLSTQWLGEKGDFGYARRIRYVLFDDGGYVAMTKRYREQARAAGLLRPMAEKLAANPNVDRLLGAASIWYWPKGEAVRVARLLQEAGLDRFIWGHAAAPDEIRALNAMGVLTSRYDNYQDVRDPAIMPPSQDDVRRRLDQAWPRDILVDADGHWLHGWQVKGTDGQMHPCGVMCDRQALGYARQAIAADLQEHPYNCRFIDTAAAAPWHECYAPAHPTTRTESRRAKMDLLRLVMEEFHLVVCSETGHDAAVPYVHYFEGMMSLVPYRIPRAGREVDRILETPPPADLLKFQTGHFYRLPLWELVYHDCVVSFWFWGDYNNKFPSLWDRRDLWNALYGTPPMYMFTIPWWEEHRDRFIQSYRATSPIARATACAEMLSHRWLTADHAVQQTRFANGVVVTANFGDRPYVLGDDSTLPPLSRRIEGLAKPE